MSRVKENEGKANEGKKSNRIWGQADQEEEKPEGEGEEKAGMTEEDEKVAQESRSRTVPHSIVA